MEDTYEIDPVHGARYGFEPSGDDGLLVKTVLEPGGGLPKHHHPVQDETWWVEEGSAHVFVDGSWQEVTADSGPLEVPSGVVHSIENRGTRELRMKAEARPAMDLEAFLTESARAARKGYFRRGGIPRSWEGVKWVAAFFPRYDDQVVMASPPRPLQKLALPLMKLIA